MTKLQTVNSRESKADGGSQTLARGLTALEIIGSVPEPISVAALSQQLNIHRSMGYRLVKTLEQSGFVERDVSGGLIVGSKLAILARGVAKDLRSAAAPELAAIAEALEMTAFLVAYDGEFAVTLSSAEPKNLETTLGKKPGSRHAVGQGAPGKVIQSLLKPKKFPPQSFEVSENEVIHGIASIAAPLHLSSGQPAAIAVLYIPHKVNVAKVAKALTAAANRICAVMG
ncbi:ArsR family transcriptional regulator [Limnohabitans sp. TS-CS-82]|uniref:helix-turn-helix domain-containing protein n=1 Tax=Limnohabitans sp. TS-CS-82 TaxID=2094193 RepID=UPI000CF22A0F|nr:helix-turn-helix domain-containing protein [Limnohabitans sp. TS-CS-82]PQA80486.1 ArsR family transcriptional regulator [Limnohabitans sp. TS-CS-82]